MDRHTELFCYVILAEFADAAEQLLAGDVLYADGTAMRLNDPVQLFDNNNFLNVFGERLNFFTGRGLTMPSFRTGYRSPQTSLTY